MRTIVTPRRRAFGAALTLAMAGAACAGPVPQASPPVTAALPEAAPAETAVLQPLSPDTTWVTIPVSAPATTGETPPERAPTAAAVTSPTTTAAEEPAVMEPPTTTAAAATEAAAPPPTTVAAVEAPPATETTPVAEAPAPAATEAAPTTTSTTTTTTAPAAASPGGPVISIPRPGDDVPARNDFGQPVNPAAFPDLANAVPWEIWNSEDVENMPDWTFATFRPGPDRKRSNLGVMLGAWSKPMSLRVGTAVYGSPELVIGHPAPPGVLEVFVVKSITPFPHYKDDAYAGKTIYQIRVCGATPETISWGVEWGRHAYRGEDGLYRLIGSDPYGEDGFCNGKLH